MKMEALGRVELPTNGLGNRCSIHLSYRAVGQKSSSVYSSSKRHVVATPMSSPLRSTCIQNSRTGSKAADALVSREFSPEATRKPSLNHQGCVKP
jgi:hypothetical protein